MELKDFIKATLHQIAEGTVEAQKAIGEHGAVINPGSVSRRRPTAFCLSQSGYR